MTGLDIRYVQVSGSSDARHPSSSLPIWAHILCFLHTKLTNLKPPNSILRRYTICTPAHNSNNTRRRKLLVIVSQFIFVATPLIPETQGEPKSYIPSRFMILATPPAPSEITPYQTASGYGEKKKSPGFSSFDAVGCAMLETFAGPESLCDARLSSYVPLQSSVRGDRRRRRRQVVDLSSILSTQE
ncbi:hypothetical protein F5Y09DRAFT_294344 [Xylaria sp. FL1042]|nr:hypothetical protein F5Y09DRAFT_294344 [Xylaria sp. FL1042]